MDYERALRDAYEDECHEEPKDNGGYAVLGDSRRALERLLAKIWDNKCEIDKMFLIIDRATGMTPSELLKKYRDTLYKREPGDYA